MIKVETPGSLNFLLSFVRIFSVWKIVAIDSNWKMDIFMINKYRNYKLCNDEFTILHYLLIEKADFAKNDRLL